MNGIILYGSRYGASQQYAQALEGRTACLRCPTTRSRISAPLTPSCTSAVCMRAGQWAWRRRSAACPRTHPFRLLVATVGLSDPSKEDSMLNIREHLAEELTPAIFIRTAHVHLRGAMDYSILQPKDKLMMKGFCTILRRQPVHERSAETQAHSGWLRQGGGLHRL